MNTYMKYIFLLLICGLVLSSCETSEKDISRQQISTKRLSRIDTIPETFPLYQEEDEIVLGRHRQNPYEIHNMLDAYDSLAEYRHNFIVGDQIPEVNTIYYRVLPRDSADLVLLSADSTVIYLDYPLDYDIESWGSYYHDPTIESEYTWLYAVVPVSHSLPSIGILEILAECYIPNEPDGNDNHYDEIPDWQNGFAMLEYMAYRISGNLDMYEPEVLAVYDEILLETAHRYLRNYQPSSEDRNRNLFWDFITGVHPEGVFNVDNTYTENREGIKNAKVFIHNIIKIYCGPLNAQGYYYSTKRFRTHCWYHIRFENHHTLTRIYGGAKFLLGPVHRHVGWHRRYGFSCALDFRDVGWRYATINNAVETYFNYCQLYNIIFPYYMRVWVAGLGGDWSGSTPLFHKRNSPLINSALTLALGPVLIFLDIPDMGLFVSQGDTHFKTLKVYELVFHEFSHASHYEKVGSSYWSHYVAHIIFNFGYGDHASGPFHGYCGIGEMWGNFAGAYFLYKYMGYEYPYIYLTTNGDLDTLSYTPLLSSYSPESLQFNPTEDWYNPGILAKILWDTHCSITDIYNALNPDVYSLTTLENSLQNQGISTSIIEQAYYTYHEWDY